MFRLNSILESVIYSLLPSNTQAFYLVIFREKKEEKRVLVK